MTILNYSFTVTLLPRLYQSDATKQYDMTYTTVYRMVQSIFAYTSKLTIVAELTKQFCIHYHGILSIITDKSEVRCRKIFVDSFRNHPLLGFVNIKLMDDEAGWIKYISKDIHQTKDLVGRPPVLRDDHKLLGNLSLDGMLSSDCDSSEQ